MMRKFLRFKELQAQGIFNDRMAARRAVQKGFPAPYEMGPNTIAWDAAEVEKYLASRPRRKFGGDDSAIIDGCA
jgi:predicted DNA-binding transcriptional regulator AlpA